MGLGGNGYSGYVKRLKIREEMFEIWDGLWLAAGGANLKTLSAKRGYVDEGGRFRWDCCRKFGGNDGGAADAE